MHTHRILLFPRNPGPQGWGKWLWGQVILSTQMLYIGIVVGVVVGLFRLAESGIAGWLLPHFAHWQQHWWIVPLWFGILACIAWAIGLLVRYAPDISGSGIPQVELRLHEGYPLRWDRVLWAKFVGSWLAIAGGLSLGREGPCIQMGAAVGAGVSSMWAQWPERAQSQKNLIIAGAAAGLGAAFGAPWAGCIFVFEEMRCRLRPALLLGLLLAVAVSQAFIVKVFGLGRILPFQGLVPPAPERYGEIALFGLLLGLAGVAYIRLLIALKNAEARQRVLPPTLRTLAPLWLAGGLVFVYPQVLGGGDGLLLSLGQSNFTLELLGILLLIKGGFSLFSYMGGVPGGLLMPMLCIGGLMGACTGQTLSHWGWIAPHEAQACVLLGMAGYFAAIVRAPLTGIALTLEMTGAWAFAPACLLVAFVATMVANATGTEPVYDQLKAQVRAGWVPADPR